MIMQATSRYAAVLLLALALAAGGCGMAAQDEAVWDAAPSKAGDYLIVDVSAGPDAEVYPVTQLDHAPPDLLDNEAFKTSRIVFRRIPAGTFIMGSPEDELGRSICEVQHQVTLTQDFFMGVFEVTQAQYRHVTGKEPSDDKGATRPVETVSWNDVRGGSWPGDPPGSGQPALGTFVALLRERTGLAFDLPTEAQWEYACRAGTTTSLNSGKNITTDKFAECPNMNEVGRYYSDGRGGFSFGHANVGSYLPNAWGLYDMHGNVSEWCLDWQGSYRDGAVTDPKGPCSGVFRVVRGGYWEEHPGRCRSAFRNGYYPSFRHHTGGGRIACRAKD